MMDPYNSKDGKARIHQGLQGIEIWVHHISKNIELVKTYDNEQSARMFISTYNGQTGNMSKHK